MPRSQYENLSEEDKYRYHRNHWLIKKYKISISDYEQMLIEQNDVCAICQTKEIRVAPSGKPIVLSVDHSHSTGKVRGLLCYKCNVMLGSANDSEDILMRAIDYLRKHK